MSRTVDTRTVEMRFDNKNFESNVKQSMSTLDKLKQKLKMDGASKGLKEIEKSSKKLEFKDLDRSIDNVGKKFSALETIATGVFLKIGMNVADAGAKIIKSFTVDQISSGWNRLANKTSSMQVIMSSLKDDASKFTDEISKMKYVEKWMEKISWFSDETSFDLPALTNGIGKLTSKAVGLEDAVTAVEGMSLWAASAGQNAQTAARMYDQLSQAVGRGYMSTQDWMSVESAQMDTAEFKELAIAIAEEKEIIKQGEVTVTDFRNTLSKKWFTKDVQIEAYKRYGEAVDYVIQKQKELADAGIDKTASEILTMLEESGDAIADTLAFKALKRGQEAKTFAESIEATNTAVATAWMNIFETITGNYLEQRKIWTDLSNDLYHIFVDPLNDITEIMSMWSRGFKQGPLSALDIAYEDEELNKLDNTYKTVTKDIAEQAVAAHKAGDDIFYEIDTMEDGSQRLIEYIRNASGEYDIFSRKIYDADKDLLSGRSLLLEGFRNIMESFFLGWEEDLNGTKIEHLSILGAIKQAFMEVFFPDLASAEDGGKKSIAQWLIDLTKKFKEFTEKLKPLGDKLKNIFKGFFTIINIVRKFITALVKPFKDVFSNLFGEVPDGVLGFADSISTWIQEFDKFLEENKVFEKVSSGVKAGIDAISSALNWLSQTLTGLPLKDLISTVKNKITGFFENYDFKGHFENIGNFFSNIIGQIKQVETEDLPDKLTPLQNFWIGFKKIWEGIKKFFSLISVPFKNIGEFISNFFSGLSESIGGKQTEKSTSKLQPIWEGIKKVFQGIVDFFEKIGPALEKIGEWLGEKISGIGDAIGEFAKNHDAKEIIEWILKGGFIASLTDFFFSISKVFGGTGGLLKSVKKDFDAIGGVLKAYQADLKADAVVSIALAIGILAASMWVLAQIPADRVGQAAGALAAIGGAVAGFALLKDLIAAIKKLGEKKTANAVKDAVKEVKKGPVDGIKEILTSVVGASIFANDKTAKFVKICLGLLLAALAILTVVRALTKVTDAFKALAAIPPEVIEKGGKVMAQVMVAFGAFAMLAGTANRSSSAFFAALGALILVFAIKKLVDVIAELGSDSEKMKNVRKAVDNFKDVFKAVSKIASTVVWIGLALAVIQTVIVGFASLGKQNSLGVSQVLKQFGKTFTRIALSLIIVSAAIAILAGVAKKTDPNDWNAVSGFFIAFISIVGGVQALAVGLASFGKRSGQYTADLMKQFGKNFIRIAASMLIIAAAFAIFKLINLDLGTLIIVSAFFAVFLGIVTILTWVATKVATQQKHLYFLENLKGIGALFLKIAAALVIVAGAFAIFEVIGHYFGTETLKTASWIFSIFAIIGLLLTWIATKNATGEKGGAATAKSNAFVKNLKAISTIFIALAGSLIIVAGAFAIMSALRFNEHSMWEIAGLFAVFMGIASMIAFVLGKFLKDNNLENTLYGLSAYVIALSASMVIIAAAFAIMDSLQMDGPSMWRVFGIFSLLMAIMGGIALATAKFITNDKLVKTLLGLSAYVIALSASMVIIAAAFAIMDSLQMDGPSMWRVFGIFAILLGIIGAIGIVAGKLLTDAASWISIALIAGLMITAAGFLYLASLAIAKIADAVPLEKMEGVLNILIVLGAIIAVMGIIGTIAGASELGSVGLAAMAVLLIAFGGACALAAKGIEILLGALSQHGAKAAKNMLLISASMRQMLQDFKDSFGSIMLIPVALIAIGIGAATAAVGLLLLAIPVATISLLIIALINSIENFIDTFSTFVDVVAVRGSAFVANVSAVLNALLDAIITTGPKLRDAIYIVLTAFIDGITSALINNIEKVANTVTVVIAVIAKSIADNAYMIRYAVVTTIMMCIMGILDALTENLEPLSESFIAFIEKLAVVIEEKMPRLLAAGFNLGKAFISGLKESITGKKSGKKFTISEGRIMLVDEDSTPLGSALDSKIPQYRGGSSGSHSGKFGKDTTKSTTDFIEEIKAAWGETPFGEIGSKESIFNFDGFASAAKEKYGELTSIFKGGLFSGTSIFGTKEKSELDLAYERGELEKLDNSYKTVSRSIAEAAVAQHKAGDDVFYEIDTLEDGSHRLVEYVRNANGEYDLFVRDIYEKQSELGHLLENLEINDSTGLLGKIISGNVISPEFDWSNLYSELDKEHTIFVTPIMASAAAYDANQATDGGSSTNNEYVSNDTYNNTFNISEAANAEEVATKAIKKLTGMIARKQVLWG